MQAVSVVRLARIITELVRDMKKCFQNIAGHAHTLAPIHTYTHTHTYIYNIFNRESRKRGRERETHAKLFAAIYRCGYFISIIDTDGLRWPESIFWKRDVSLGQANFNFFDLACAPLKNTRVEINYGWREINYAGCITIAAGSRLCSLSLSLSFSFALR